MGVETSVCVREGRGLDQALQTTPISKQQVTSEKDNKRCSLPHTRDEQISDFRDRGPAGKKKAPPALEAVTGKIKTFSSAVGNTQILKMKFLFE